MDAPLVGLRPSSLRKRVAFCVLSALLTSLPSAADLRAQATSDPALPSTIIPNYDRIRVGQVEGLEGGAYVARTGDAGANWYNPAGLASAERTSLNASADAIEYTKVQFEVLDAGYGSGRFTSLGTYFAGVIASPVIDNPRLRLGFSLTRPVVWSPGAVSAAADRSVAGARESVGFYAETSMTTSIPAVAAGYRVADRFRLGVGVSMPVTNVTANQEFTNRLVSTAAVDRLSRSLSLDVQSLQLQLTAGAQWDVTDAMHLGASVTTPGTRISGSGLVALRNQGSGPDGSAELTFRDAETDFDYRLPLKVVGGVATTLGRLEIEADVRYYAGRSSYAVLASDTPYTVVITDATGTPTVSEEASRPILEKTAAVTNLAVGANFPLSEGWRIHGGVFTDRSPVGDPASSVFRAVDLAGFALAISFGGSLSGTIGVSSSAGTTDELVVGPSLGGATGQSSVKIRTFNLHYALSYTFD